MSENPKRLASEEVWATALAVIGGLAILVPLIVFALGSQKPGKDSAKPVKPPPVAGKTGLGSEGGTVTAPSPPERRREADSPIPTEPVALRKELQKARKRIDALGDALEVVKADAEASERSAQRAWIQLREAAGEPKSPQPDPEGKENGES